MLLTLTILSALEFGKNDPGLSLFELNSPAATQSWRSVDDDVMGGVSDGAISFVPEDAALRFTGMLSLENNGGFSSIRSPRKTLDLGAFGGISLRVRGDGRTYKFNVHTPRIPQGGSHRIEFKTVPDRWITVFLPFDRMVPTFHGRELNGVGPVERDRIHSLGITLADGQAGPFRLDLRWIRAGSPERED